MTPPPDPPPAAGPGEAAGACPDGACACPLAPSDAAPAITAAARKPRRGMQQGQPENEVRATVADMDASGAKLQWAKLRAVRRCPYTSSLRPRRDARIFVAVFVRFSARPCGRAWLLLQGSPQSTARLQFELDYD